MVVHNREVEFALTVGASADIAELCPDGDISKLGELFSGDSFGKQIKTVAKVIAALSRGAEDRRKYENVGYEPNPLTVAEIMTLTTEELKALEAEAFKAFVKDSKPTVELESSKK